MLVATLCLCLVTSAAIAQETETFAPTEPAQQTEGHHYKGHHKFKNMDPAKRAEIKEYFQNNPNLSKEEKRQVLKEKFGVEFKGHHKFKNMDPAKRAEIKEYFQNNPNLSREEKRQVLKEKFGVEFKGKHRHYTDQTPSQEG